MQSELYTIKCPHCGGCIQIQKTEINCGIFRHAAYVNTNLPINPHASKTDCEELVRTNKVFGCGKPFKFDGVHMPEICDYV